MISEESLNAIIRSEREVGEQLYPRPAYLGLLAPFLPRKEVLVLTGVRRAGKSTIMKLLMHDLLYVQGVGADSVAYVNLEDYRLSNSLGLELLQKILETRRGKRVFLFLDEIQAVNGWEKWARTIYDREGVKVKLVVSGSNASLLSKEYSTTLTGRNLTFRVRPLSYPEYLAFGEKGIRSLEEYLIFGGFPEVVLAKDAEVKRRLLRQYFEDIVNKDVINRHSIRNSREVFLLARFLAANPGQRTSFNRLAKTFGFRSTETIMRYAQYLKDTFLFSEAPFHSYSIKVRHDQSRLPKYYVCDNGIISVLEDPAAPDRGKRLENTVFNAIQRRGEVTYWAGKNEVDFVIGSTAINVTTSTRELERETLGLKELALEDGQVKNLLLVSPIKLQTGREAPEISVIAPEEFLKSQAAQGNM